MEMEPKPGIPFEDRTLTLRDGRSVRVRRGGVGDAAAFRVYLRRAALTTDQIGLFGDEVGTLKEVRQSLASGDAGGLLLLAESEGDGCPVVGHCRLSTFPRRKMVGVLAMGMLCDGGWRGVGLGRALLEASLGWARANASSGLGVRRVELDVLVSNPGAVALYESVGFVVEGRRPARVRQADGSLVDDLAMGLDVASLPGAGPAGGADLVRG